MDDYLQIELLKNLLAPDDKENKATEDDEVNVLNSSEAQNISKSTSAPNDIVKLNISNEREEIYDKYAIWNECEVPEVSIPLVFTDEGDNRERPKYDILYKQIVDTNDVYLGLDFEKDPSSSSAESLVVKIELPKERSISNLNVDVTPYSVALTSETYKLYLNLPCNVYDKKGDAKWDSRTKTLTIILPIDNSNP
jgi:hypothetical protein